MMLDQAAELTINNLENLGLYGVWLAANEWYSHNFHARKYHNLQHALKVCNAIYEIVDEPSVSLMLAAKWHDAVYVPLSGSDANESCSAAALEAAYRKYADFTDSKNRDVIDNAKNLIMGTTIANHLMDERNVYFPEEAALQDADLSSLAANYNVFIQTQKDIIAENYGTFERDQRKSAEFLGQFLYTREYIYHTDKARELWESKARANIEQYLIDTK